MKRELLALASMLSLVLLGSGLATAETTEKRVIAIKTGDFELAETDVSDLAIGEAETIVTDSGKTVDILRTAEGMEIYVDGELLDMSFGDAHGAHQAHKQIMLDCDGAEGECEDKMILHAADHGDGEIHKSVIRKVHVECISDDETDCSEEHVWISKGDDVSFGDVDIEELIESDGEIRIIRAHDQDHDVHFEDGELHESHEVIVVHKEVEEKS